MQDFCNESIQKDALEDSDPEYIYGDIFVRCFLDLYLK